jgi:putative salt-induced outer membrane protein YdiY
VLTQDTLDLAETEGNPRDRTETDHNLRAYLGYEQRVDDRLKLLSGLEFYKSFVYEPSYRINWNVELQTQLSNSFSLAIGSTAMYNNAPLPGVKKFDVTTALNFVYTFL